MKSVKRAIWLIFGLFSGPLFSPKQFLKKSYKETFLAISILFRGNLWKIPQQFGENLEKKMRFWANLGCSWSPWEPRLVIVFFFFFFMENLTIWPIVKVCIVLKDVLAKIPKIVQKKEEKWHSGLNFGLFFTILHNIEVTLIVKILKLKVALLDQGIHWNNFFNFIQKYYGIHKLLLILWKIYFH